MMAWYLVDENHISYNDALNDAMVQHGATHPDNVLSVVHSDDNSEAVIKVDDAVDWSAYGGLVTAEYDKSNHNDLITVIAGPNWSNQRVEIE